MAQQGTAQHGTARHGTAQHGTAQHGTAQPAQHSTARHSRADLEGLLIALMPLLFHFLADGVGVLVQLLIHTAFAPPLPPCKLLHATSKGWPMITDDQ